ncbi:MAG: type I-B CRISPR-associated protein Cas5, partial [Thermodesulfobacterium geofontis]
NKEGEILLEGFNKILSKSPTYVINIFNIYLTIYIKADENCLKKFKENLLRKEFPSIGRKEYLARIDYIDFVEAQIKRFSRLTKYKIQEGIYLNKKIADTLEISGINYRMNFKYYKDLMDKTGLRYFEKKDVVYVDSGTIEKGEFLFDKDEDKIIDLIGDLDE